MPRTDDSTAYAANWWQVLCVDAGIAVVVVLLALVFTAGAARVAFVVAGAAYLVLVARRAARWRALRRDAGL